MTPGKLKISYFPSCVDDVSIRVNVNVRFVSIAHLKGVPFKW